MTQPNNHDPHSLFFVSLNVVHHAHSSANMLYLTLIHKRTFTDHKRCGEAFLKLPEPDGIAKTLSLSLDHKMRFAGNLKVRLTYAVVEGGGAGGASSSSTTSGAAAAASRGPASAATSSGRASMSRAEVYLRVSMVMES